MDWFKVITDSVKRESETALRALVREAYDDAKARTLSRAEAIEHALVGVLRRLCGERLYHIVTDELALAQMPAQLDELTKNLDAAAGSFESRTHHEPSESTIIVDPQTLEEKKATDR